MSENRKAICISFKNTTFERLEETRWSTRINRSQFVDLAVQEKLERLGLRK
jgi:hypothetical protein